MYGFHNKFSSRATPRNFEVFVFSARVSLIFKGESFWDISGFLYTEWNKEYFVLDVEW